MMTLIELAQQKLNEAKLATGPDIDKEIEEFIDWAYQNWEDDVWPDAVQELLNLLLQSNPKAAQEWVQGNTQNN